MAQKAASRAIKLFGTETPDAKRRELKAGPLTAVLDNGGLRYIRYHGAEVLRGIAYLIRDKNWGTYAPAIEGLKVRQTKSGFTITYSATCRDSEQAISYHAKITADAKGALRFSATGTPQTDFITCRAGFVVLHPLEGVVGKPMEVMHVDGSRERRKFPKFISPGQPVFEIRSLKHAVMPGLTAAAVMEGNKFEMEDHRNWMDASYKTYVCSLLDPWPYTLPKGKSFTQSVSVTVAGKPSKRSPSRAGAALAITVGRAKGHLPAIGTGVPMKQAEAALEQADLIAAAKPASLVCQIDGRLTGQLEAIRAFAALKASVGSPVTLEIILPAGKPADEEMAAIAEVISKGKLKPEAIVVTQAHDLKSFQPGAPRPWGPSFEEMAAAARRHFPGVALGGGMLSYFTELNRKPPTQGLFDFITHTVCPIVHAADDISVMEALESLPSIFASTRAIVGSTPYHLGPSSIPCRDNPYGAGAAKNPGNGRVCLSDADPRQRGLFAAAWSLGLVAAASRAGLASVAIASATGSQGLIYRKMDQVQPWYDRANASVYPTYHVLAGLAPASGARRLETISAAPSQVAALAYQTKRSKVLWLANLTAEMRKVKIDGIPGASQVSVINEASFAAAAKEPAFLERAGEKFRKISSLDLGAYAVTRITTVDF